MTNTRHGTEFRSPPPSHVPICEPHPITTERDQNRFANSQRSLDRRLDEALEETFPASDPVSVVIS
jgi:hypothetical protein